MSYGSTV